jgi:hypothetical protein
MSDQGLALMRIGALLKALAQARKLSKYQTADPRLSPRASVAGKTELAGPLIRLVY